MHPEPSIACAVHHLDGRCPRYGDNVGKISFGPSATGIAKSTLSVVPPSSSEIERELNVQDNMIAELGSQISSLCARLEPVLHPAPDASQRKSELGASSQVGSRINMHTERVAYLIGVVQNLRDTLAV